MFDLSRRINGRTYYVGIALLIFALVVIELLGAVAGFATGEGTSLQDTINLTVFALDLVVLIGYGTVLARQRANDINGKHPLLWFALLFFTPIGAIGGFIPGEKSTNRYGEKPKPKIQLRRE